jgi:hypothetical protein
MIASAREEEPKYIPLFPAMTEEQIDYLVDCLEQIGISDEEIGFVDAEEVEEEASKDREVRLAGFVIDGVAIVAVLIWFAVLLLR